MQLEIVKKSLAKKLVIPTVIVLIAITVFAAIFTLNLNVGTASPHEFYVGIEIAYGNYSDFTAAVDAVKNYTNLIVFGLPELTKNQT